MDASGVLAFPMPPGRRHSPSRQLELKLLEREQHLLPNGK
jgi:hypothetical protein